MTFEEFTKIGMAIKTYYPKEHDTLLKDEVAIKLWYESLKDLDYTNLMIALHKWVETERWSPTIADLRRLAFEVRNPAIPTWDEAWENVLQAVRHYGTQRMVEAMETFDEVTRKTVARVGWIQICTSEQIGIERAAFRDIYNVLSDKTKEQGQIAPAIRKVIEVTRQANRELLTQKAVNNTSDTEKPSDEPDMSDKTRDKLKSLKERLKHGREQTYDV